MTEPLLPLARFAFDWADILCDASHGCAQYHRMWSVSRLLEYGGALPAGADFFRRELAAASSDGKVHVIISGGADTGLMAIAVEGARKSNLEIHVTAVDRCKTPLEQMRLYGEACGVRVDVHACTLDKLPADLGADVIVGHSILQFIPPDKRNDVFSAWKAALRPGGRIILWQRLDRPFVPIKQAWNPEEMRQHQDEFGKRMDNTDVLGAFGSRDAILDAARAFWQTPLIRYEVKSEDVRSLALANDLSLLSVEKASSAAVNSPSPFVKTEGAQHVPHSMIVLEKPLG